MHRNCFITDHGYLVALQEMVVMCVLSVSSYWSLPRQLHGEIMFWNHQSRPCKKGN